MDINNIKNKCSGMKGQTAVETVLVLLFFIGLMFFVIEGARFMWVKNSLNNAARIGARVAVVDSDLVEIASPGDACTDTLTGVKTVDAVCNTPEARKTPLVDPWLVVIDIQDKDAPAEEGDTVSVYVSTDYKLLVNVWGFGGVSGLTSVASMRYE